MRFAVPLALVAFCASLGVSGQDYTAIHGSTYFGSLNVYNNPSSIVNTPYKWDLAVAGIQFTTITNAIRGHNFPFYLMPSSKFTVATGNYARKADFNFNVRLLNLRYSISKDKAFAFGVNIKGYAQGTTGRINYTPDVKGPLSFLTLNEQNRVLHAQAVTSSWIEAYGAYAFTILNNDMGKLTAGATLKISRGMSGAFVQAEDVVVMKTTENDREVYKIANGHARYGYSSNYGSADHIKLNDFFSGAKTSGAIDLGVEYVIKTQAVASVYDRAEEAQDYEWKIGVALLDLGTNRFQYAPPSRQISTLNGNVTSEVLQEKFFKIKNIARFNDSLATIVQQSTPLDNNFSIANPARAVINVDKFMSGNFYINGELSLNLLPRSASGLAVRESNLLTLTPRWEKRKLGFYAPVQCTQHGNVWVGGAIKAGPLLFGTHDLLNFFSSNSYLSGGAYLALFIRPSDLMKEPRSRQYDCPTY